MPLLYIIAVQFSQDHLSLPADLPSPLQSSNPGAGQKKNTGALTNLFTQLLGKRVWPCPVPATDKTNNIAKIEPYRDLS